MDHEKQLRDMSVDEIAQLKNEVFQKLTHDHNDHLEVRERARDRQIEAVTEERNKAKEYLQAVAAKMPREEFEKMPLVNTLDSEITVMYGIPDPTDPANPLCYRASRNTPLEKLIDKAWGTTYIQALFLAGEKQQESGKSRDNPAQPIETLPNPDREIDDVFKALLEDAPASPLERKTLVQTVVGAVKEWNTQRHEDLYDRALQRGIVNKADSRRSQKDENFERKEPSDRERW